MGKLTFVGPCAPFEEKLPPDHLSIIGAHTGRESLQNYSYPTL